MSLVLKLEDIAWDELDQIDDHIVPHPSNEHENEPAYQKDGFKKLQHEVIGVSNNAGHFFPRVCANQKEEGSIQPQKKKWIELLEKESCFHSSEGVIPDSRNCCSSMETTKVSSDSIRVPVQCLNNSNIDTMDAEFGADDSIASEVCAVHDTNSSAYSLGDMSQTENDLSFLDNDREDETTALLYYGWPDIENFEDVDRMFRSCDSTFGFASSYEDDLAWLSSTHDNNIKKPECILKSDFSSFKSIPEQHLSKLNNASSSTDKSNIGNSYMSYKSGFQGSECVEADPIHKLTFMNGSASSDRKGEFTPKDPQGLQFNSSIHFNNPTVYQPINGNGQKKKQATRPNLSEGKRKNCYRSRQVFSHPEHQKQKNVAPNSFGYLQTPTPYMHLNYVNPSNQISVGSEHFGIKSEVNTLTSVSPRESSYASNQARSVESSHCHPFSAPFMSVDDKLEKLRRRQVFYHSSAPKQVHHSQNEAKNHSGVGRVNVTNLADRDYSNVPETSCMNSGFDEISLEASSFRQLQQAMEQLDMRTRLCIRDSLYRLARSAEQRHRYANMKGGGDGGDIFKADGSDNGLMDMETDTNPIDRSVAHLLFHRPSDPSTMPAHDVSSLKPHLMIHGSVTSPSLMVEQPGCQEEAASEANNKCLIDDNG